MKKTIRDYDLNDKKVIIRVDFNVPIIDGVITDDNRIVESLETINYAIKNGAKVILMSHLGRVESEEDKASNSLLPVSIRLSELLGKSVTFIDTTRGVELEESVAALKPGEVLLVENTRFEDVDGKKESKNNPELGEYWASLGDVFINDAFGTAHRAHASNVGIASILPNGIGFLIEKELEMLLPAINNPKRPFTVILGGSKVSDKIAIVERLTELADYILIGGGMSHTFLKASGYDMGTSRVQEDFLDFCKNIMEKYPNKIILPLDVVTTKEFVDAPGKIEDISSVDPDEMALDIGPKTVELFSKYISDSSQITWNGTMGVNEFENFITGTKGVCEAISKVNGTTIIGGGDTASAVIGLGHKESFTHISTGGGASLELLEGKDLPGISIISE